MVYDSWNEWNRKVTKFQFLREKTGLMFRFNHFLMTSLWRHMTTETAGFLGSARFRVDLSYSGKIFSISLSHKILEGILWPLVSKFQMSKKHQNQHKSINKEWFPTKPSTLNSMSWSVLFGFEIGYISGSKYVTQHYL